MNSRKKKSFINRNPLSLFIFSDTKLPKGVLRYLWGFVEMTQAKIYQGLIQPSLFEPFDNVRNIYYILYLLIELKLHTNCAGGQ